MIIETENEQEVLDRLESPDNLVNKLSIAPSDSLIIRRKHAGSGKKEGDVDIPNLIKEVAIEAAHMGGSQREIGDALGISQSVVSNSSRGLVHRRHDSNLQEIVDEVKDKLAEKRETAHDRALDKLLESFSIVDEEMARPIDTEGNEAPRNLKRIKQATAIAKDLAAISGVMRGRDEDGGNKNNVLIIEVPPQKTITHYQQVIVGS